jgi:hypothetical protein
VVAFGVLVASAAATAAEAKKTEARNSIAKAERYLMKNPLNGFKSSDAEPIIGGFRYFYTEFQ